MAVVAVEGADLVEQVASVGLQGRTTEKASKEKTDLVELLEADVGDLVVVAVVRLKVASIIRKSLLKSPRTERSKESDLISQLVVEDSVVVDPMAKLANSRLIVLLAPSLIAVVVCAEVADVSETDIPDLTAQE